MRAFILAGGFATRLWPLTERRAKPLLPLAGKPLLSHLVERVPRDVPVTVSTNAAFESSFEAWKEAGGFAAEILIEDARHDDRKLGALGAVARWVNEAGIDDDILLLAGDNYCGFTFEAFLKSYQSRPLVAAFDIQDMERAKAFGTVILKPNSNAVAGFEEKPVVPKTTLVSTGCSVLPRSFLPILIEHARAHPDNIGGIFEEFLRRGVSVDAFVFAEPWFDIGSFQAYLAATRELVGEAQIFGSGTENRQSGFAGSVVTGADCRIIASDLHDVVMFDDCIVEDCVLRDCVLDSGCRLKGIDLHGQMLRAGTVLRRRQN